jgi:hypothetical protein
MRRIEGGRLPKEASILSTKQKERSGMTKKEINME